MKILLFGKQGQLGWELQRSLSPLGKLLALDRRDTVHCGDLADMDGIRRTVDEVAPDVIVNAAAYTAVDRAETDAVLAQVVNADAVAVLATQAARIGALLVHYSTDYVFDGGGVKAWCETDQTGPLSVYGRTKLAGEDAILSAGCDHLIFRTSWVYGARGGNFAKTMLRLASEREELQVVNDQFGAPTGADLLADVTAHAVRLCRQSPELSGIYHLVAAGETSWHAYAQFVIEHARRAGIAIKVGPDRVKAVPSTAFPTPAIRPKNSRLDSDKLQTTFGLFLPEWQVGVNRMLTEILEK
jgi:dTDP-4-dehydrorhamnose reductase